MRDKERGVVWEESIVMAPRSARFVFLSATIPNAKEFADWVAKVRGGTRNPWNGRAVHGSMSFWGRATPEVV